MKNQVDINWTNFEILKGMLGTDTLLNELFQAMSSDEAKENIEFIARMHDIEIEE